MVSIYFPLVPKFICGSFVNDRDIFFGSLRCYRSRLRGSEPVCSLSNVEQLFLPPWPIIAV